MMDVVEEKLNSIAEKPAKLSKFHHLMAKLKFARARHTEKTTDDAETNSNILLGLFTEARSHFSRAKELSGSTDTMSKAQARQVAALEKNVSECDAKIAELNKDKEQSQTTSEETDGQNLADEDSTT